MLSVILNTQIRTTAQLIKEFGVDLEIHRPLPYVTTVAGGRQRQVDPGSTLLPQRLYIGGKINNRINNLPLETFGTEGEMVRKQFVIVGMCVAKYGLRVADLKENDYFTFNGLKFYISSVDDEQQYQIKAEVRHFGT